MKTFEHGTYGMYRTRGCRCEDCKVAAAETRARYRTVVPGTQPKNYSVSYGSIKLVLDATPIIEFIMANREPDRFMMQRIRRWERNGIDVYQADRIAVEMGTHPALIWGWDFYKGCEGYE